MGSELGLHVFSQMPLNLAGSARKLSPYNLNEEDIVYLNNILKAMKHIKKIYVDINGNYHLKAHQYTGDFPEFKDKEGKFYSRMGKQNKKFIDPIDRREKYKGVPVPLDEFEIVAEYKSDFIFEEFSKIKK